MAYSQHTIYGGGLVAVIIAACVAGIAVTGGPGEARKEREDRARQQAVSDTALALACYHQAFGEIPEDLTLVENELARVTSDAHQQDACTQADIRKDPVTGEDFRLTRQAGVVTQICAEFATGTPSGPYNRYSYSPTRAVIPDLGEPRETGGERCFDLNLSAKLEF
ncbi:hypothetical protein [Hyphomonas adhaerens]|uniref:hypothetical protein n=1 Tax=Hyphomonas adhaerens TaxID=81029 RepID=UPI0023547592|nr:hypothetical protein [Hyphomonas adhaerens]